MSNDCEGPAVRPAYADETFVAGTRAPSEGDAAWRETLNRAILESSTDYAIVSLDLQGRVTSWNEGAARILGWREAEMIGRSAHSFFTPEDVAGGVPENEMGLTRSNGRAEDERFHLRRDGTRFWAAGLMMPLRTEAGEELGYLKVLRDRTAEHQARESLKASEARLRLERSMIEAIFQYAPVGLSLCEAPDGASILLNEEFERLAGVDARLETATPESSPTLRALEEGAVVRREPMTLEGRDGVRRVEVSSTPLHGVDGEIAAAITVLVDVEERERALERQQLLIGELGHRMKNTLAMVQAIVSQTLRGAPSLEVGREQIMQRFAVLARAQDVLTQTSWDSATLQVVVEGALAPLAQDFGRFSIEGPEVRLGSRAALNITLALHELATNAVKYGALSTLEGRVEIDWRLQPAESGEELVFTWNETGGPPVSPPSRKGFGTRLIDGLTRTFSADSQLIYAPAGLCWRMRAELSVLQA